MEEKKRKTKDIIDDVLIIVKQKYLADSNESIFKSDFHRLKKSEKNMAFNMPKMDDLGRALEKAKEDIEVLSNEYNENLKSIKEHL